MLLRGILPSEDLVIVDVHRARDATEIAQLVFYHDRKMWRGELRLCRSRRQGRLACYDTVDGLAETPG